MANTGDILAPQLLADGTFEEVTLTPAAIGAASLADGLVPATQLPPISYQSITHIGDGLTSAYAPPGTLTASDSPSAISVTINGVTQEPNADYTLDVAANRVVLSFLLPHLDKLVITRPILLPSASTLTAEQLGAASTQALATETAARIAADATLQAVLAVESLTLASSITLPAARAKLYNVNNNTFTEHSITLPDNGIQTGDIVDIQFNSSTGRGLQIFRQSASIATLLDGNAVAFVARSANPSDWFPLRPPLHTHAPFRGTNGTLGGGSGFVPAPASFMQGRFLSSSANAGAGGWVALSIADTTGLQSALDSKAPLLWDTSLYNYQTSAPDDIPITARRKQRLQIRSYTPKANGATLLLPRRDIDGALDGDELEITLKAVGTGVTATIYIRQYIFTGQTYVSDTSLRDTLVHTHPSSDASYLYRLVGGVWERVPLLAQSALDSKASTSALAALEARVAALEAAQP